MSGPRNRYQKSDFLVVWHWHIIKAPRWFHFQLGWEPLACIIYLSSNVSWFDYWFICPMSFFSRKLGLVLDLRVSLMTSEKSIRKGCTHLNSSEEALTEVWLEAGSLGVYKYHKLIKWLITGGQIRRTLQSLPCQRHLIMQKPLNLAQTHVWNPPRCHAYKSHIQNILTTKLGQVPLEFC